MCWEMGWRGLSTVSVYKRATALAHVFHNPCPLSRTIERQLHSGPSRPLLQHARAAALVTYLPLNMTKIDPQFLQQWRLPIVPFRSKRRYPASPQSPLLSHAPTDALPAKTGRRPKSARARVGLWGRWLAVAVMCLRGSGMAGDGGWVGGLVELEVLGVVGGLLLRVVLGHGGQ